MSLSNIEKINTHFKIPIIYNDEKKELNENIITDLELIQTLDSSCTPMFEYAFQPKTIFGKKVLEQFPSYYTTDIKYLKDSQKLIKNYKSIPEQIFKPDFQYLMEIWDEIKNDISFKDKYQYIDFPFWEWINRDTIFLQLMSIYNLASPVLSFFVPFIIVILILI
jgi:hypothetical protein